MGLPTSIPSGGDGLDRFSEPAPRAQPAPRSPQVQQRQKSPAPRQPDAVAAPPVDPEYEAFLRWKAEKEAPKSTAQETVPARRSAPAPKPVQTRTEQLPSPSDRQEDGWEFDSKTGKYYKPLPAAPKEAIRAAKAAKGAGLDLNEMKRFFEVREDFDIDDLNSTAETFMAHLRIPPSKEEQEAILRRKAELAQEQREKRAELDQELNAKEGLIEEPESDPFLENQKAKRGLFGRKN